VVDSAGNLKPWASPGDNIFNIGSDSGNAVKSVFAKTSFNSVVYGREDFEIPNDSTTGTVANQLAVFNTSSPSQAVLASTSSTNGVIGVVAPGSGGRVEARPSRGMGTLTAFRRRDDGGRCGGCEHNDRG